MKQGRGTVHYEVQDGIAVVTLCRPDKRNALTGVMLDRLSDILDSLEGDGGIGAAVIRGEAGAGFCAGDDLGELVRMSARDIRGFLSRAQSILTRLESLPLPAIAAVEGYALGGGLELALSCDIIHAAEGAFLGLPETNLGILPGMGGTIRLPRRVGLGRAKEMIFSGRLVGAPEARAIGLVEAVFPGGELFPETMDLCRLLAAKSPTAIALAKSVVNRGMDASLEAGLALERESFAYCFSLPDAKEGIRAFLEKRKPDFR